MRFLLDSYFANCASRLDFSFESLLGIYSNVYISAMTRFIKITITLLFLCTVGTGVAIGPTSAGNSQQLITVTGRVVSVIDGEPLVGAFVALKNMNFYDYKQSIATDRNGKWPIPS